jgi:hypothetical protein
MIQEVAMGYWDFIKTIFGNLKKVTGSASNEIQPRDILDKLVAELERKKKLGIEEHAFVPNSYVVYLSPSDFEEMSPLLTNIRDQLRIKLMERVKKHGYRLLSTVLTLDIREDGVLQKGQVVIESSFLKEKIAVQEPVEDIAKPPFQKVPVAEAKHVAVSTSATPSPDQTRIIEDKKTKIIDHTKLTLDIIEGEGTGEVIGLREGEYTFGRGRDASILIKDSDEIVSRIHFKLFVKEGFTKIKDLNSSNGTMVNGIEIDEVELKKGDIIAAGKVRLRVA